MKMVAVCDGRDFLAVCDLSSSHYVSLQAENGPSTSTSKPDIPEPLAKFIPRPAPVLAGAYDLTDIRTLLREWVTTITGTW